MSVSEADVLREWKTEINNWAIHYTTQIQIYQITGWIIWSLNIFLILLIQIFRIGSTDNVVYINIVAILSAALLTLSGIDGAIKPNLQVGNNESLRDECIIMMDNISFFLSGLPENESELVSFTKEIKLKRQDILKKSQTQIPNLIQ